MIVGTAVDDQSASVACQGSGAGGGYACDTRNISVEWYGQTEVGPSGEGFPHDLIGIGGTAHREGSDTKAWSLHVNTKELYHAV